MKKLMKRIIPLVLIVAMCLCMAAPAFAAASDEDVAGINSTVLHCYKVTASSGANMRSGASTAYGIVASYSQGTYLYYAGSYTVSPSDNYMWLYLRYGTTYGWVRADLVQYVGPYYT